MGALPGDSPPMGRPSGRSRVSHRRPSRSLARCSKPGARRGAFGCGPVYAKLLLPEAGAAGGRRQGSQGPPTAPKPRLRVQQALLCRQPKTSCVVGATSKTAADTQDAARVPAILLGNHGAYAVLPRQKYELAHRQQLHRFCETRPLCAHYAPTMRQLYPGGGQEHPPLRPLSAH